MKHPFVMSQSHAFAPSPMCFYSNQSYGSECVARIEHICTANEWRMIYGATTAGIDLYTDMAIHSVEIENERVFMWRALCSVASYLFFLFVETRTPTHKSHYPTTTKTQQYKREYLQHDFCLTAKWWFYYFHLSYLLVLFLSVYICDVRSRRKKTRINGFHKLFAPLCV